MLECSIYIGLGAGLGGMAGLFLSRLLTGNRESAYQRERALRDQIGRERVARFEVDQIYLSTLTPEQAFVWLRNYGHQDGCVENSDRSL